MCQTGSVISTSVNIFLFVYLCLRKQAVEDEGGNPDEIIIVLDAAPKKANATPKRAAKGKVTVTCAMRRYTDAAHGLFNSFLVK